MLFVPEEVCDGAGEVEPRRRVQRAQPVLVAKVHRYIPK